MEVKSEWRGTTIEDKGSIQDGIDSIMGVRKPTFKRPFNPTTLGSNHVYHSIPMMMVSKYITSSRYDDAAMCLRCMSNMWGFIQEVLLGKNRSCEEHCSWGVGVYQEMFYI